MKIELKNVSKTIRGAEVLKNITCTFESGKVYGLRGHNGSGKTMLIRAICGLIRTTEGEVIHDGKVIGKDMEFPESVGLLLEKPAFLGEESGFKNLEQIAAIRKKTDSGTIRELIREVGLDPEDKKKYRKYSLGMKQRLGIAGALLEDPKLLILDEPTNALDTEGVSLMREILKKRVSPERIIILASHDQEELTQLADEILEMQGGRLIGVKQEKKDA